MLTPTTIKYHRSISNSNRQSMPTFLPRRSKIDISRTKNITSVSSRRLSKSPPIRPDNHGNHWVSTRARPSIVTTACRSRKVRYLTQINASLLDKLEDCRCLIRTNLSSILIKTMTMTGTGSSLVNQPMPRIQSTKPLRKRRLWTSKMRRRFNNLKTIHLLLPRIMGNKFNSNIINKVAVEAVSAPSTIARNGAKANSRSSTDQINKPNKFQCSKSKTLAKVKRRTLR